jgi:hypothetical protein
MIRFYWRDVKIDVHLEEMMVDVWIVCKRIFIFEWQELNGLLCLRMETISLLL